MRQVTPKFDESGKFAKDVQVALDENYLNFMLFTMFYDDKPFSLTEKIIEMLPSGFEMAGTAVKALLNTNVVGQFMPTILDEFGAGKRVDLRCGFNKDYLAQAHMQDISLSQVHFRKGNRIDMDLHFGCAVYVYMQDNADGNEIAQLFNMIAAVNTDLDSDAWRSYRSFFVSTSAELELDLSESA